jgi:tetratricopeptide (TPR) repeat protein
MLSEESHNKLRGMVVKHTQLRQRIYFQRHDVSLELLKGVAEAQAIFELKFFSLIGLHVAPEVVEQYESLFYQNPRNIWAYYQLFEHYAYQVGDWDKVLAMAKHALLAHPRDEKVLLDLSRFYLRQGNRHLARELGLQAVTLNPDFDLVHEHLGVIAGLDEDIEEQLEYTCKAVGLAPGSPINHLNLGLALCEAGNMQAAEHHLSEALKGYPDYARTESTLLLLREHFEKGRLPAIVAERLGLLDTTPASGAP